MSSAKPPPRAAPPPRDTFAAVPDPSGVSALAATCRCWRRCAPLPGLSSEQMLEPSVPRDDPRPLPPAAMRTSQSDRGRCRACACRGAPTASSSRSPSPVHPLRHRRLSVWQWPNMVALYQYLRAPATEAGALRPRAPPAHRRFPTGSSPAAASEQRAAAPAPRRRGGGAACRALRRRPGRSAGKRYVGSAIWRTETVSPGPGQPPELAIRADVEIPERKHHHDVVAAPQYRPGLPASHTIEIMFKLPADFPGEASPTCPAS